MSLEALLAPIPPRGGTQPCKVGRYLSEIGEPYRSALRDLLRLSYADGGLSDEALAARMNEAKLFVSATVVNRHRRETCACEREAADVVSA